ncbi:ubiquitin conjugating enzyme [Penicillium malachiteum]|nr:ubiquitin conjugating enzyme [Penicillium malachiteum]
MAMAFAGKRLSKELLKMNEHLPPGITLVKSDNLEEWQMDIKVLDENPLYKDQTYRLKFTFSDKYPIGTSNISMFLTLEFLPIYPPYPPSIPRPHTIVPQFTLYSLEPPEVQFIELPTTSDTPRPIPIHPHIYSNGIICLDLLGRSGWSPVQTVESVCMSLQSMLTANTKDERPPGNNDFVAYNRRRIRDINFVYEDDNV